MKKFLMLFLAISLIATPSAFAQKKHSKKSKKAQSTAVIPAKAKKAKAGQEQVIKISGVTIDITDIKCTENPAFDEKGLYTIKATAAPSNATDITYKWIFDENYIAGEADGEVFSFCPLKEGDVSITCTAYNAASEVSAITKVHITLNADQCIFFKSSDEKLEPADVEAAFSSDGNAKFDYVKKLPKSNAFDCNYMVHFTYPVDKIPANAYYKYNNISAVSFPGTLKVIEENAFGWCKKLTAANFPMGLETIDAGAFYADQFSDKGLKEFTLPKSLKFIGKFAFRDIRCSKVYIPEDVKMDEDAFFDSGKLKDVYIYSTVPDEVSRIFWKGTKVHVKAAALPAYQAAPAYSNCKIFGDL